VHVRRCVYTYMRTCTRIHTSSSNEAVVGVYVNMHNIKPTHLSTHSHTHPTHTTPHLEQRRAGAIPVTRIPRTLLRVQVGHNVTQRTLSAHGKHLALEMRNRFNFALPCPYKDACALFFV